jgi:hypothetical protein
MDSYSHAMVICDGAAYTIGLIQFERQEYYGIEDSRDVDRINLISFVLLEIRLKKFI